MGEINRLDQDEPSEVRKDQEIRVLKEINGIAETKLKSGVP